MPAVGANVGSVHHLAFVYSFTQPMAHIPAYIDKYHAVWIYVLQASTLGHWYIEHFIYHRFRLSQEGAADSFYSFGFNGYKYYKTCCLNQTNVYTINIFLKKSWNIDLRHSLYLWRSGIKKWSASEYLTRVKKPTTEVWDMITCIINRHCHSYYTQTPSVGILSLVLQ